MRIILITFMLTIFTSRLLSQPVYKDTYWKLGRHAGLDFSSGTAVVNPLDNCQSSVNNTNTSICISNNQVLFYSNGQFVLNKNDSVTPNGWNCGAGTISSQYFTQDYFPPFKAAVMIPDPGDSNKIYMVYENLEWTIDGDYLPEKLYYLVIDKRLDNGKGDVTLKDQIIIQNDTLTKGEVFAIKHGNGKDWWIICRKYKSNRYYKVLIDSVGVHAPISQDIGIPYTKKYAFVGVGNVSKNGEKLVLTYENFNTQQIQPSQTDFLDFDRCTGNLFNYNRIYFPNVTDTIFWAAWCFSPNNHFVYCHDGVHIYQLDLTSSNLVASKIQVGLKQAGGNNLGSMKIGPDNKIYIGPYGSSNYLHVINDPDSMGTACNFQLNAINFGGNGHWADGGMPNVPNFALGKINCNVGINEIPSLAALEIYPNPSSGQTKIKVPANTIQLNVYNGIGELIAQYNNPFKAIELNIGTFAKGMYLVEALKSNGKKEVGKMIVSN